MFDAETLADLQGVAESALLDVVTIMRTATADDGGGAPAPVPPTATAIVPACWYYPKLDLPRATVIAAGDTVTFQGGAYVVDAAPPPGVYDVLRTVELVQSGVEDS